MKRKKKGEYHYLDQLKSRYLWKILLFFVIGLAIFLLGLVLNKMEPRNIFSVIAILMVLPGAKQVVGFVVTFPYHSVNRKEYDEMLSHVKEGETLYVDMLMTSRERIMLFPYMAEVPGKIIALCDPKEKDVKEVEKYLSGNVRNYCSDYQVCVFSDKKYFIRELGRMKPQEVNEQEREQVLKILFTLVMP